MGNGKMIRIAGKERLAGIGDLYEFKRKSREQELQQEPAGKMLQPFVRMGNCPVLGHIALEESFGFFNFPNAQAGRIVDLLLKKNRHRTNLRFKIADLTAIPETFLNTAT
jgi:hypothetical protein